MFPLRRRQYNTNKGRNCVMQSLPFLFVKSKIQNTRLHAYTVTRLENGSSSLAVDRFYGTTFFLDFLNQMITN